MPDFENFIRIINRESTDKRALFELFLNKTLYEKLAGRPMPDEGKSVTLEKLKFLIDAFKNAGYDYATTFACNYQFQHDNHLVKQTISLNIGAVISDRRSFENYPWKDMVESEFSCLDEISDYLPGNMKLNIMSPGGVLENVIQLAGFDALCFMMYEDEQLFADLFDAVGKRLLEYYEIAARYDSVGILTVNDDWGFKTQTFFSVETMRKYVFPWHKKIVEAIHKQGKPALLHSCGNLAAVMDDIIDDMRFDAKHSFEDSIITIEDAYSLWGDRICLLGGIDVNFLISKPVEEIKKRCKAILSATCEKGGYMLGSGNSIPDYIPQEKYFAMISCIQE